MSAIDAMDLTGSTIDGYQVLQLVGTGGFSKVYKVHPVGLPNQFFALKLVPDSKHFPLLQAEAEILSQLNHPGFPKPIKIGNYKNSQYLIMDFIPRNLQKEMETVGFGYPDACEIVCRILTLLHYAHQQNIIHKDLKPSNIGLDDSYDVHLLDFNISKNLLDKNLSSQVKHSELDSNIVQVGGIQKSLLGGTDGYSSPEQRRITTFPVDARSDIYSVGVMLYQLLSGGLPQGNYKKLSKINAGFPKWLDRIIDKSLDPIPAERYGNALEMVKDIKDGIAGLHDNWLHKTKLVLSTIVFEPLKKVSSWITNIISGLFRSILFVIYLPYWIVWGIISLYNGHIMNLGRDRDNEVLWVFGLLLTASMWIVTLGSVPAYFLNKSYQQFESDFRDKPLTGTIIFHNRGSLFYFQAQDAFKDNIALQEVSCPAKIEKLTYFDQDVVVWLASEGRDDDRKNNSIYITSLRSGIVKKILDNTGVSPRKGFFKSTPLSIISVRSSSHRIFFEMENGLWFSMSGDGTSIHEETAIILDRGNTSISPDGLLRITDSPSLKLERSSEKWGSYSLPFSGSDPIWISEILENHRK